MSSQAPPLPPTTTKKNTLSTSDDLLICMTCGTQYDIPYPNPTLSSNTATTAVSIPVSDEDGNDLSLKSCRICDDPRQYVPPSGQAFTTLGRLRTSGEYRNVVRRHDVDQKLWEIWTEGKIGIGQRAILIQTPHGNVLWDLIAYLDQETVDKINELGGLKFIVISHPHFYTTWADWSATFNCPVYLSQRDAHDWANRTTNPKAQLKLLTDQHNELLPGLTAVIAGGHFPGSMFMHSAPPNTAFPSLFVADTIMSVPSARNPDPAKPGVSSYTFMWSIPNMIPLPPDEILKIWKAIKPYDFVATYGLMKDVGEVREHPEHRMRLKQRVLESAKIHCRHEGYDQHPIFTES